MSNNPILLVIGSGPGIGVSMASLFAQKHFAKIVLLSRNENRLQNDKRTVLNAAKEAKKDVEVVTYAVDISNLAELRNTLSKTEQHGSLGCVFFNPARVAPSTLLEFPVEEIELDFKTTTLALYEVARWAIPHLQKAGKDASPSLFVTNSLLYKEPLSFVFSLSLVKTAQRSLVLSLHQTYGKEVHIALVSVEGQVSPDKPHMSPTFIAGKVSELYEQPRGQWQRDIEILEK